MKKLLSGKVREVYEAEGDRLVIVTTDRISAFDVILPRLVKDKGKVLNALSLFWFDYTKDIAPNHVLSGDPGDMPPFFRTDEFAGRVTLVKKLAILPFEFIVRGYLFGNMWQAYIHKEPFCGHIVTGDYQLAQRLDTPLLTPSTKAQDGEHDAYLPLDEVANAIGADLTRRIHDASLRLYAAAYAHAYAKGIIIADTKFEFGLDAEGGLVLADEIFTPDSSRFWSLAEYRTGVSPRSYDKQFVRDWLQDHKTDGDLPFDRVPDEVLEKTAAIYQECAGRFLS